jgi:hypothetical protein
MIHGSLAVRCDVTENRASAFFVPIRDGLISVAFATCRSNVRGWPITVSSTLQKLGGRAAAGSCALTATQTTGEVAAECRQRMEE